MPRGGKREGSGRKTKAEELGLAKMINECISEEEERLIWAAIKKEAKKGSLPHAQLFLSYKYGKPTENVKSNNYNENIIRIVDDGE